MTYDTLWFYQKKLVLGDIDVTSFAGIGRGWLLCSMKRLARMRALLLDFRSSDCYRDLIESADIPGNFPYSALFKTPVLPNSIRKVFQERPMNLLVPTFLLPVICRLREKVHHALQSVIVRYQDQDILIRIALLQLLDRPIRLAHIVSEARTEECLVRPPTPRWEKRRERRTRAGARRM